MPVNSIKYVDSSTILGFWEINETTDQLLNLASLEEHELEIFNNFSANLRRKQWLAYRALLRHILPDEGIHIHYSEEGKPYLKDHSYGISISHTRNLAAVIASKNHEAGIDMEFINPRILKIRDKFISEDELATIDPDSIEVLTAIWCAKETLYKLNGRKSIDFRKHIRIYNPDLQEKCQFRGSMTINDQEKFYSLTLEKKGDLLLVYGVDKS